MIKVIATDLDGTLFYPKRKLTLLTKKNTKFLRKYVNDGNKVVLVSGRNTGLIKKIFKKTKVSFSLICCNGALICSDDKVIQENCLSHQEAKDFYCSNKDDRNIKVWMIMTGGGGMYTQSKNCYLFEKIVYRIGLPLQGAYREKYIFGDKAIMGMLDDENIRIYKMMPIYGYTKKAKEKAKAACEKFSEKYKDRFDFAWSNEAVEVMKKGINKASALECLLDYLKVDKENVAVIGDSGNDVLLFKAYHANSFVMSHAHEDVKKEAKTVIDSVSDIEKYL